MSDSNDSDPESAAVDTQQPEPCAVTARTAPKTPDGAAAAPQVTPVEEWDLTSEVPPGAEGRGTPQFPAGADVDITLKSRALERVALQSPPGAEVGVASTVKRLSIDDPSYEDLENEFQEVLEKLKGDQNLEGMRIEFEKLYFALTKTRDSEKRIMKKCRELNSEILINSAKVKTAMKISQEDKTIIEKLKKDIETMWKTIDQVRAEEVRARETVESLKLEIVTLSKLVEAGEASRAKQSSSKKNDEEDEKEVQHMKENEDLRSERDTLLQQLVSLRKDLGSSQEKQVQLEVGKDKAELKIFELNQNIQKRDNELQRELRVEDSLKKETKKLKTEFDSKERELKETKNQVDKVKEEVIKSEVSLNELKQSYAKSEKEVELLKIRLQKTQEEFAIQDRNNEKMKLETKEMEADVKTKEQQITDLKQSNEIQRKKRDTLQKDLRSTEDAKADVEAKSENMRGQIIRLERALEQSTKQADSDEKIINELRKDRDMLNKKLLKSTEATQKQIDLVKIHERSKKDVEKDIERYKGEAQKQRNLILQLEKEIDRYINEASEHTEMVVKQMEFVRESSVKIYNYKKKIAESTTLLNQQETLYEAVRSDRNLYAKNLVSAKDELTEIKGKLEFLMQQIDRLKEELTIKDVHLTKKQLDYDQVERENDALKAEKVKMEQKAAEKQALIEAQASEEKRLLNIIAEAKRVVLKQKIEKDQMIRERNILGTQLIKRNDELTLLYEKIRIQQSTLSKGEMQYRSRMEDIKLLKLEIKKLQREKSILKNRVKNVDDLRGEVFHLQKELLRERTRLKALESDLHNPMNIHRWRKLEGSDPQTYEMIMKIQFLQKCLITKTEEVNEKELDIQDKERLYMEMKRTLARQPGPEVAEQILSYQSSLREKVKQLKGMTSELNMFESQVKEYKYEIENLTAELQDVKKKYFIQKRKEQQLLERERVKGRVADDQGTRGPLVLGNMKTGAILSNTRRSK